jgi:2-polyprenyl-6-hydroxyphenyl methylase/3-demethylubiquinone-9 3-methyltransferase
VSARPKHVEELDTPCVVFLRGATILAVPSEHYAYFDDEPTWSNAYLWPPLLETLRRVAPPPRAVFELGCGNGATARMLAAEGYSVTAVDPSSSGIAIAGRHENEGLRFGSGSTAEDLAARYGRFPVVISLEVIEHCPSAREFMQCFRSLIAPGGVGILSTPYHGLLKNLAIVASGRFDRHFDPLWEGGHVKFFTEAKLRALFDTFGFERYELRRVGRVRPFAKSTLAVLST